MRFKTIAFFALTFLAECTNDENSNSASYDSWAMFNGNYNSNKYSSLTEIDTSNVQQLEVAWEYHTGDVDTAARSQIRVASRQSPTTDRTTPHPRDRPTMMP